MSDAVDVARSADRIRSLVADLDRRSGGRTRLLPVTKAFPIEAVDAVRQAGLREVGENYAQELLAKRAEREGMSWHLIGGVQRNKVRRLVGAVDLWHTIDRPELVAEVARRVPGATVLLQVDAVGLPSRSGCTPHEVEGLLALAVGSGLEVRGLMTVGAPGDPVATRRVFGEVARLAGDLGLRELSMGMTDDLEEAVDAGSTLVRVGRALFGERPGR